MIGNGHAGFGRGAAEKDHPWHLAAVLSHCLDRLRHPRRRAPRPRPSDPPGSRRRDAPRARRADQAESSEQAMSTIPSIAPAVPPLGKRGAFEGVARRHGRRRNPARMTPRSSLRTPTNQALHSPQRWVEKADRSIKGSDTPHSPDETRHAPPTTASPSTSRDVMAVSQNCNRLLQVEPSAAGTAGRRATISAMQKILYDGRLGRSCG